MTATITAQAAGGMSSSTFMVGRVRVWGVVAPFIATMAVLIFGLSDMINSILVVGQRLDRQVPSPGAASHSFRVGVVQSSGVSTTPREHRTHLRGGPLDAKEFGRREPTGAGNRSVIAKRLSSRCAAPINSGPKGLGRTDSKGTEIQSGADHGSLTCLSNSGPRDHPPHPHQPGGNISICQVRRTGIVGSTTDWARSTR